jgi:hypothetical protein
MAYICITHPSLDPKILNNVDSYPYLVKFLVGGIYFTTTKHQYEPFMGNMRYYPIKRTNIRCILILSGALADLGSHPLLGQHFLNTCDLGDLWDTMRSKSPFEIWHIKTLMYLAGWWLYNVVHIMYDVKYTYNYIYIYTLYVRLLICKIMYVFFFVQPHLVQMPNFPEIRWGHRFFHRLDPWWTSAMT